VIRRTMAALAIAAVFVPALPCFAGSDGDFHAVVASIERQYGVRHTHIPLLGFATFCVRFAGVPGLKIAVFEHVRDANGISADSLEDSMDAAIGNSWRPLVRVRDRGELTLIYTNPSDKTLKVLVVCFDGDDATVVQTKVTASQIRKWMRDPDDAEHARSEAINAAE
jgi:hypothetical protein